MIRLANHEDAQCIGDMWLEMVEYHHLFDPLMFRANADGAAQYARRIEQQLLSRQARVLVADIDGVPIGYASGMIADITTEMFQPLRSGLLSDLYVRPSHRQRGIGRELVERMMIWFRSQDIRHYEWHVSAHNRQAIAFWRALGGETTMLRMRAEISGGES